jgi:hypothetical protein
MTRTRILGVYLIVAGLLQAVLYVLLSISKTHDWLFYFDPRIGIFFLESMWKGGEPTIPGVERWLTVVWLLAIGVVLITGRQLLWFYIVPEILFSLPTVLFFVFIVLANLSPSHGFSVGELFLPILVTVAFSLIPLVIAFRAQWQLPNLDSPDSVRA